MNQSEIPELNEEVEGYVLIHLTAETGCKWLVKALPGDSVGTITMNTDEDIGEAYFSCMRFRKSYGSYYTLDEAYRWLIKADQNEPWR